MKSSSSGKKHFVYWNRLAGKVYVFVLVVVSMKETKDLVVVVVDQLSIFSCNYVSFCFFTSSYEDFFFGKHHR